MSFQYPDFSKYFDGPQRLPNEIMILIHDYQRKMFRTRFANLEANGPHQSEMFESIWIVGRGMFFMINETCYSDRVPFLLFQSPTLIYREFHCSNLSILRVTHRGEDRETSLLEHPSNKV